MSKLTWSDSRTSVNLQGLLKLGNIEDLRDYQIRIEINGIYRDHAVDMSLAVYHKNTPLVSQAFKFINKDDTITIIDLHNCFKLIEHK